MNGEIRRVYLRHKVFGNLHAVEIDDRGEVLTSAVVGAAAACPHSLVDVPLKLDGCDEINKHRADYELFEPVCSDPTHILADLGAAERECGVAQKAWEEADRHAKALKKILESKQERVHQIVRDATTPSLFTTPVATA